MIATGIDSDSLASLSEPTESEAKENEAKVSEQAGKTTEQERTAKTAEQAAKESEAKASEQAAKKNVVKASEKAGKRCPNGFMSVNEMEGTETMWNVKTKTTNGVDMVVRTLDCESFALAPICGPHSINKPEPNMTIALTVQITLTLIQTHPRCLSWV